MDMSPKIRDSAGMKNTSPQTIKQTIKKRSIEQVEGMSAVEDSLCPGLNGKEVTIRTNFTMTVKEPVKPYGLKIELVISDIDFAKNQEEKRGIMNYVEALGKNFFSKPDFAGGPLKCYPEKGNMVITSKVGMPFDVKAFHYIFANAVGKKLKYDSTFPSIDAALEKAKPWYNKGDYAKRNNISSNKRFQRLYGVRRKLLEEALNGLMYGVPKGGFKKCPAQKG
mmetsp:Transcript_19973/g.49812  ORF Transcript_19973/g.49812 Transcript_19973/m.49812 type:complete len:223 (-) Transcript_19973:111-779(-)